MKTQIVVVISDESARKSIVKILSHNRDNEITEQPFVPDIISFLKSGGYNVAVIDAEYLEKLQEKEENAQDIKNLLPSLSIIAWMNKYDAARAVSVISQGALDVLCPPLIAAELISVIGYHAGGFYLKRKSDFSPGAKILRKLHPLYFILPAVIAMLIGGYFVLNRFYSLSYIKDGVYTFNIQGPSGIYVDGKNVYVSEWVSQTVIGFKMDSRTFTGVETESYYLPDCNPLFVYKCGDIIFTGGVVSSSGIEGEAGTNSAMIYKYSLKKDKITLLLEKFLSPGPAPSGFTVCSVNGRGKNGSQFAYSVDSQTRKIYQHLASAGYPVVNSYNFAGISPVGIVYDGKYFYIADARGGRIYKHLGPVNNFVPVAAYNVRLQGADKEIAGFYKDRKNFYIISGGGREGARLYVVSFKQD